MDITTFFTTEFKDFSLYSSFRGLASYVDGFKPASRKAIYTVERRNITQNMKVANLAAAAAESTSYLHAISSLEGAIVLLAQDFSNNCNLLAPEGNFGNPLNHEASSPRYIFTKKSKWFDKILDPRDRATLKLREFEGETIEPFYYVPVVPLILVNGSNGIGSGYAQKIFPRKLNSVINAIEKLLAGKQVKEIIPSLDSFSGDVVFMEGNKIEVRGKVQIADAKITVLAIPFSYDLVSYQKKLDQLVDDGVIKSYKDLSENGLFKFEVKCTREFSSKPEAEILSKLYLVDKLTENFSCISEKDSIVVFKDEVDLLKAFIKLRLKQYGSRKETLIAELNHSITELKNKVKFLKAIMAETLVVYKKPKAEIEKALVAGKYDKLDGSYEYLLTLRIDNFTTEKLSKLDAELAEKKTELVAISEKDEKTLWLDDLNALKKAGAN